MSQETERQRTEQAARRDLETRVNARIDDAKAYSKARFDELKADGEARDAKLYAHMIALARLEAEEESRRRARRDLVPVWIGFAVAAAAIIISIASRLMG